MLITESATKKLSDVMLIMFCFRASTEATFANHRPHELSLREKARIMRVDKVEAVAAYITRMANSRAATQN